MLTILVYIRGDENTVSSCLRTKAAYSMLAILEVVEFLILLIFKEEVLFFQLHFPSVACNIFPHLVQFHISPRATTEIADKFTVTFLPS